MKGSREMNAWQLSTWRSVRAASVAGILVLLQLPAWSAGASAALTDFTFELVDLDPADGLAPTMDLTDRTGGSRVDASVSGAGGRDVRSIDIGGRVSELFLPGSVSASTPAGWARASVTSRGLFADAEVSGTAFFSAEASTNSFVTLSGNDSTRWQLGPKSMLRIRADYSLSAHSDGDHDPRTGNNDFASATVMMNAFGNLYVPGVQKRVSSGLDAGTLYLEVSNPSDQPDTFGVIFYAWADGSSIVVPEPGSGALVLAGFGLVVGLSRRKRASNRDRSGRSAPGRCHAAALS